MAISIPPPGPTPASAASNPTAPKVPAPPANGSKGPCAACHQRHEFSLAQARRPETCGKCHLGPDHPQKEIYDQSKHGINFYSNVARMNLDSAKGIVGEDHDARPTFATFQI